MSRYRIEEKEVGRGGFGKVRRGFDTELDRDVAVKVFDPLGDDQDTFEQEDKARFRREAKTLAKLRHPHVPSIYDVNFEDGKMEIIFEFVDGRTLREILDDDDYQIGFAECRSWFDQIASALQHAHEIGILHRDIKPENIIVTDDRSHCYLVDFGLALQIAENERLTGTDYCVGTPGYMSPEQEAGGELDASDDIYVLGVCLYEALSGHKIKAGDYEPLHLVNELIPQDVDMLIKRCIDNKPRRLNSAEQFRTILARAYHGNKSVSEVLNGGQLIELVDMLGRMTPTQFNDLKKGQRLLAIQKCEDLVSADESRLTYARDELLAVMVRVGINLEASQYKRIVSPAMRFAFGTPDQDGIYRWGQRQLEESLSKAAASVSSECHSVICTALKDWQQGIDLRIQKSGFFHGVRNVVRSLMANSECDDSDADFLAEFLAEINTLQRESQKDGQHVTS